jgi:hypothetical protein
MSPWGYLSADIDNKFFAYCNANAPFNNKTLNRVCTGVCSTFSLAIGAIVRIFKVTTQTSCYI